MPDQERPDPSRRRLLQALLAPALLASCGGGSDGNADGGTVTLSSLTRTSSGDSYDLYVYTPAPSVAKGRTLPVVYVLDGASWITTIASIMDSSQFAAYVVGIGRADLRTRDYLEPGAAGFYDFIVQQLAPFIESNRAVQAGRRVLVGHSYARSRFSSIASARAPSRPTRRSTAASSSRRPPQSRWTRSQASRPRSASGA